MKRKFITIVVNNKKCKIFLEDLTKIHQIVKKNYPKTPKFKN